MRALRRERSALHDEVHEVLVVDVALRVLLALQQLLHLRTRRNFIYFLIQTQLHLIVKNVYR